jgi:hypothetical protein
VTISEGTNQLYTGDPAGLTALALEALEAERRPTRPELWDGRAAERIAEITLDRLRLWPGPASLGQEYVASASGSPD